MDPGMSPQGSCGALPRPGLRTGLVAKSAAVSTRVSLGPLPSFCRIYRMVVWGITHNFFRQLEQGLQQGKKG